MKMLICIYIYILIKQRKLEALQFPYCSHILPHFFHCFVVFFKPTGKKLVAGTPSQVKLSFCGGDVPGSFKFRRHLGGSQRGWRTTVGAPCLHFPKKMVGTVRSWMISAYKTAIFVRRILLEFYEGRSPVSNQQEKILAKSVRVEQ